MAAELNLDYKIKEMALRIRNLREIEGLSIEEMAVQTGISPEEYMACEAGNRDLNFTFIYRCANAFGVNVTEIIEGNSPKLKSYTLTRLGDGQQISQAHGMTYYNLAYSFQNRIAEPLYVRCVFDPEQVGKPIEVTTHNGQECDIVVEGRLKVQVGEHTEILGPGDSIYYNSGTPHGMVAVDGTDCIFYAIVLNPEGKPIPELMNAPAVEGEAYEHDDRDRIYKKYIDVEENADGTPTKITFKNTRKFNFAFDLVDELAAKDPEKLAMLYISNSKEEKRITFRDMMRNQTAVRTISPLWGSGRVTASCLF